MVAPHLISYALLPISFRTARLILRFGFTLDGRPRLLLDLCPSCSLHPSLFLRMRYAVFAIFDCGARYNNQLTGFGSAQFETVFDSFWLRRLRCRREGCWRSDWFAAC